MIDVRKVRRRSVPLCFHFECLLLLTSLKCQFSYIQVMSFYALRRLFDKGGSFFFQLKEFFVIEIFFK